MPAPTAPSGEGSRTGANGNLPFFAMHKSFLSQTGRFLLLTASLLANALALTQSSTAAAPPPLPLAVWPQVVRTHLRSVVALAPLPGGGAVVVGTMPGGDIDGEGQPRNQGVVTKWSAAGRLLWTQRMDFARQVAVVGPHVYVLGYRGWGMYPPGYFPRLPLGDTAIVSRARREGTVGFVVKLLDEGNRSRVVWVKQIAERNYTPLALTALAVRGSSLYVGGHFHNGPLHLDGLTLAHPGEQGEHADMNSYDGFVAKLEDEGASARFVWAHAVDGEQGDYGSHDQVLHLQVQDSAVFVAGTFQGRSLTIGPLRMTKPDRPDRWRGYPDESLTHTFVAKLLDRGSRSHVAWGRLLAGPNEPTALAVQNSQVYLAGRLRASCAFDSLRVDHRGERDSATLFLAQLDDHGPSARFAWVGHAGDSGVYELNALVAHGPALYLGGRFPVSLAGVLATGAAPRVASVLKLLNPGTTPQLAWALPADSARGPQCVRALAAHGPVLLAGGDRRLAWGPMPEALPTDPLTPAAKARPRQTRHRRLK